MSMKRYLCHHLAVAVVFLTACTSSPVVQEPVSQLKVVTLDNTVKLTRGQTVYVPVYSHIYYFDRNQRREFATTLSIRNTDLTSPIIVTSTSYYNTNGKLVRKYLDQPVELNPLAATHFVVNLDDTTGGVGASFIVEWVTTKEVSDPVIEAVMIHTPSNQGLSLISNGRVIKSWRTNKK
jgi:Protein of unknown function (DUF3124)